MFHDLLTHQSKSPQLQSLIDAARAKNAKRKADRLQDLFDTLKSLDSSSVFQFPNLKSPNFYFKIFGLEFGTETNRQPNCKHLTCQQFFIDKLSETSSVMPNHSSLKDTREDQFRSFSRTRTRESNNISLVKLLKIQGQLGRQHKQNTLFSHEFMRYTPQQQSYADSPVDKIWKLHPALSKIADNDKRYGNALLDNLLNKGQASQGHNSLINNDSRNLQDGLEILRKTQIQPINSTDNRHQMMVDNSESKAVGHNLENSQGERKALSEEGRGEMHRFNDDEEIKELKA